MPTKPIIGHLELEEGTCQFCGKRKVSDCVGKSECSGETSCNCVETLSALDGMNKESHRKLQEGGW